MERVWYWVEIQYHTFREGADTALRVMHLSRETAERVYAQLVDSQRGHDVTVVWGSASGAKGSYEVRKWVGPFGD